MSAPERTAARLPVASHARAVAGMAAWGTVIPTIALLLPVIDPYSLSAVRYGICGVAILIWLALSDGFGAMRTLPWGRILLLGSAMAAFNIFYTVGIALSDPVTAIIVGATSPVISALFAALVYRVRVPPGAAPAFLLAAVGAAAASLGDRLTGATLGFRGGEILIVCAMVCWAWYSVQAQRWLGHLGQIRITAVTILGGALLLVVALVGAAALGVELRCRVGISEIGQLLWLSLGVTLGGVLLWNRAVAELGIISAALYLNLVPVFAILLAAALGVYPSLWQIGGCACVLLGVILLQRHRA